ncbi:hypothetical protein [Sorangium sp. So ce388]|uniref:hypothetical protein n=1 Tax=Sorangium sp. So ce388 TaxID=3133309 RepID=UPI003F5C1C68
MKDTAPTQDQAMCFYRAALSTARLIDRENEHRVLDADADGADETIERRPGPLAILLGANGAGQTALLDTLRGLQAFILGELSSVERITWSPPI